MEFEVIVRVTLDPDIFYSTDEKGHQETVVEDMVRDALYDVYDLDVVEIEVEKMR
tara:strand:+ start:725 stop:889 length:165 start_codon:yes stop_codon:yes gene_type:complete